MRLIQVQHGPMMERKSSTSILDGLKDASLSKDIAQENIAQHFTLIIVLLF